MSNGENLVVEFILRMINEITAPAKDATDDLLSIGKAAGDAAKPIDHAGEVLDDLAKPAREAADEAREMAKALSGTHAPVTKAAQNVAALGKTATGATGSLDAATAALYDVAKPAKEAAKDAQATADAFDDMVKPARDAAKETENAARAATEAARPTADLADKVDDAGDAMEDAGRKGHGFNIFLGFDMVNAAHLAGQAIAAIISGIVDLGRRMIDWVSDEAKFAEATVDAATAAGVTAESYQRLSYAFDRSNLSADDLDSVMKSLNQKMVAAIAGNKQAAAAFAAAGVKIKDVHGHYKAADRVLGELADTLGQWKDGTRKSAAATLLFGEAGERLIPILKGGSAGIKALGDEAERTNQIMSDDAIASSKALNEAWEHLHGTTRGLQNQLWQGLAPALTKLVGHVDELIEQNKADILEGMKNGLTWLDEHLDDIIDLVTEFAGALKSAVELAAMVGDAVGRIKDAWNTLPQGLRDFLSHAAAPVNPLGAALGARESLDNRPASTGIRAENRSFHLPAAYGQSPAHNTLQVTLDKGLRVRDMQSSPVMPMSVDHLDFGDMVTP